MKHRWEAETEHRSRCKRCSGTRLRRPNPYARQWLTEYDVPDGNVGRVVTRDGAPPCAGTPPAS